MPSFEVVAPTALRSNNDFRLFSRQIEIVSFDGAAVEAAATLRAELE